MARTWVVVVAVVVGAATVFGIVSFGWFSDGDETSAVPPKCAEHIVKMTTTWAALADEILTDEQALKFPTVEELEVIREADPELYGLYAQEKTNATLYELVCRAEGSSSALHNYQADFILIGDLADLAEQRTGPPQVFLYLQAATKCQLNEFRERSTGVSDTPDEIQQICSMLRM